MPGYTAANVHQDRKAPTLICTSASRRKLLRGVAAERGTIEFSSVFGRCSSENEGKALAKARQESYQLRTYALLAGPQFALTQGYFVDRVKA